MKNGKTWAFAALFVVACCGLANADLSWQTTPILGTSTTYTGDVVVITGPTPTGNPLNGGGFYYDTDGNLVLGPTIPHYSMVGDPLFGIGSPSMTLFNVGQTVDAGSGVWVDIGHSYGVAINYVGPSRTVTSAFPYGPAPVEAGGFVMNYLDPVSTLTNADVGLWHYTQTWTDLAVGGPSITYSTDFTVVPVPGAVLLGFLGLGAAGIKLRKFV